MSVATAPGTVSATSPAARNLLLLRIAAWTILGAPLAWGVYRWFWGDGFGFDPVEEMLHYSGLTAVWVLIASLAITPVRRWTGFNALQKIRRLTGLWAFAYATMHLSVYVTIDQWFDWVLIVEDLRERPFILSGSAALALMVPLAVTSTKGWIRRLGRRWVSLHRLVYLSAGLALLHFWWGQKADLRNAVIAAAVLAVLLGARVWWAVQKRRRAA